MFFIINFIARLAEKGATQAEVMQVTWRATVVFVQFFSLIGGHVWHAGSWTVARAADGL